MGVPSNNSVKHSSEALDQIIKYLTRGPIIAIIGFLIFTNAISLFFLVKILMDSRDRENKLNKQTIDLITEKVDQKVEERVAPVEKEVRGTINNIDSNLVKLDSVITKRRTNEK